MSIYNYLEGTGDGMNENIDKVDFSIIKKSQCKDGNNYEIEIRIPESLGFIDNVKLIVQSRTDNIEIPLNFIDKNNGMVYFKTEYFLKTKALYHYHFSFTANGQHKVLKKEGNEHDSPSISEKWKMSVNFDVPEWAKGKIMYHIFVDRFNRGNSDKPIEMPRRTIYSSFDDEMIVGFVNPGKCDD